MLQAQSSQDLDRMADCTAGLLRLLPVLEPLDRVSM